MTSLMGKFREKTDKVLAGGEGFEPPLAESESAVLPLDDPPGVSGKFKAERAIGKRLRAGIGPDSIKRKSPEMSLRLKTHTRGVNL